MNIQFKDKSLYDKFNLSTTYSRVELMRVFQTRPELRKELPLYVKTLSDERSLYLEELFSVHCDNINYNTTQYVRDRKQNGNNVFPNRRLQISALVDMIRNFPEIIKTNIDGEIVDELICNTIDIREYEDQFTNSKVDVDGHIFSGFCECLWKKMDVDIKSIVQSQDSKDVNALSEIISSITFPRLKDRFYSIFVESISTYFDSICSRLNDKNLLNESVAFIVGLNKTILNDKDVYISYKFLTKQIFEDIKENENVFYDYGEKLLNVLHKNDYVQIKDSLRSLCFSYIQLQNINEHNYNSVKQLAEKMNKLKDKLGESCLDENTLTMINLLVAITDNGDDWYKEYSNYVVEIINGSNISDNLFKLCSIIYQADSLKNERQVMLNLIIGITDFELELKQIVNKKQGFERVVEKIKDDGKYFYFSTIKNEKGMISVCEIDEFIIKYYALTILDEELKKVFTGLIQIIFSWLILAENVPNYGVDPYAKLTPKGEFMLDFFREMPNDWTVVAGESSINVEEFLSDKLFYYIGSSYGDSKSKSYVDKCDAVTSTQRKSIKTSTKTSENTNTHINTSSSINSQQTERQNPNTDTSAAKAWGVGLLIGIVCFIAGLIESIDFFSIGGFILGGLSVYKLYKIVTKSN